LEKDYMEDLGVEDRMIFKYILKQWRAWSGFIWLRKGGEWLTLVTTVINHWFSKKKGILE